jgi:hypothetical protein
MPALILPASCGLPPVRPTINRDLRLRHDRSENSRDYERDDAAALLRRSSRMAQYAPRAPLAMASISRRLSS